MKSVRLTHKLKYGVALMVLLVGIGIFARIQAQGTPTESAYEQTFDPAHYGLPNIIAGYRVLAVLSHENQHCLPPDFKRIIIQIDSDKIEGFHDGGPAGPQHQSIAEALHELDSSGKTTIETAGLNDTRESIMAFYSNMETLVPGPGCPASLVPWGHTFPLPTPTADVHNDGVGSKTG